MLHCGLIGEKLSHTYSPQIHAELGNYEYKLFELNKDELDSFFEKKDFDALNVTIPYKREVQKYLYFVSDTAKAIGSVNTIVKKSDGKLYGYNTDAYGISYMLSSAGISVKNKKCIILGSGGTRRTVQYVLNEAGAKEIVVISRSGENNYENIYLHYDADIIINTTPVGMYPNNGDAAVDLNNFTNCTGVIDVIYNPFKTRLILDAESLNIPNVSGLSMLVAQAKMASELFQDVTIDDSIIPTIVRKLSMQMLNIILIGMPGCGKTTIGKQLSATLGKEFVDIDAEIENYTGRNIPDIIGNDGEEAFREIETKVISDICKRSGLIISTGGGCVTKQVNYNLLHQNGRIIWLQRDLNLLPKDGRPLSQANPIINIYNARKDLYSDFSDIIIDNNISVKYSVTKIIEELS